ncbi:hypothetical protein SAMN04487996_11550 [Dyadobacter soli]|uniref:Uncharacterized protein n=1 Tax=Dyadobacter soli TaxID=659014 RepID=A0A1G7RIT1_9BACT|nr:hypothetical protein [Dyadobacter soli]SDG10089.1 hypothetical protein SAMN04487996_11550 [Dyadobacter soli]
MAFKSVSAGIACIVVLALATIWMLLRKATMPPSPYKARIIAINKLLYKLRKECITGQVDVAQNTFGDVKQEWRYLDVTLRDPTVYSSDNLQKLDSLVRIMYNKGESKRLLPVVLNEINAVNNKLDKIH